MNCISVLLHIIHYIIVVSNYENTRTQDESPRCCSRGELVCLIGSLHA